MPATATTKKKTTRKSTTKTTAKKKTAALSPEEHARAAYFNWLQRGAPAGDDQRDWFDVECR